MHTERILRYLKNSKSFKFVPTLQSKKRELKSSPFMILLIEWLLKLFCNKISQKVRTRLLSSFYCCCCCIYDCKNLYLIILFQVNAINKLLNIITAPHLSISLNGYTIWKVPSYFIPIRFFSLTKKSFFYDSISFSIIYLLFGIN